MPSVLTFTGGKRCEECEEQIDPRRLRLSPHATLCTRCEQEWELKQRKLLNSVNAQAVVVIRR